MIKKITVLTLLIILCFSPNALANDGGSRPDTERLSFTCEAVSTEIRIGEEFISTYTVTNHTHKPIEILPYSTVIPNTYVYGGMDDFKVTIDPYQTVEFEVSFVVPENLNYYIIEDVFYADFRPELVYMATIPLEDEEEDFDGVDTEWDYYRIADKAVRMKVTNLFDGSEYADITFLDKRDTLVYTMHFSGYSAKHFFYMQMQNKGQVKITDTYCTNFHLDYDTIKNIEPGKSKTDKGSMRVFAGDEENITETEEVKCIMLFRLEGDTNKYYVISASRTLGCQLLKNSDFDLIIDAVKNKDDKYAFSFTVVNNTENDLGEHTITASTFSNVRDIKTLLGYDDIFDMDANCTQLLFEPLELSEGAHVNISVGKIIDNVFYYNDVYYTHENPPDLKDDFCANFLIMDLYHLYEEIEISGYSGNNEIPPEMDDPSTVIPLPTLTPMPTELPIITLSPAPKDTDAEMKTYYIPTWVWIALIAAGIIVVILTAYITIKNNEKR